jgi:hypothetical protein
MKRAVGAVRLTIRSVVLMASLACLPTVWAGEYRGTAEQQSACTPDAFRLCGAYIPFADKVEACLRQRKSDLSLACRSVFEPARRTAVSSVR